jgi:hypothetical protein
MTGGIATRVQIPVPFIWLPLGLGIGRLVFRALNAVELALAVVLTAAMLADHAGVSGRVAPGTLIALWAVLVGQVAVLRPRLDRRARRILAGQTTPRSHLHLAYITLKAAKVVLLTVLGALLVMRVAA